MADLLGSLLPPLHSSQASNALDRQSSNESFHSTASQTHLHNASDHAVSALNVRDIDEYLNDPENAQYLVDPPKQGQKLGKDRDHIANATTYAEPIPIDQISSGFVSALHETCQGKGLPLPIYDLEQSGEGHFTEIRGKVRIGDFIIENDRIFGSKKAAKERLSELALPKAKEMLARRHDPDEDPKETTMLWISRLNEYALPRRSAPTYHTFSLGSQFSVVLTLALVPGQTFGDKTKPFASKKDAQVAAAKEAVQFLMSEGHLDENGRPIKRKASVCASSAPSTHRRGPISPSGSLHLSTSEDGARFIGVPKTMSSVTQRAAELAILLGLMPPSYHLAPVSPQATAILNGHATIGNAAQSELPGVTGPIGRVETIYGKNNAKAEIAAKVWELLVQAARSRGFEVREV